MKILLYNPSISQGFGKQFEMDMTAWAPEYETEYHRTAEGLSKRLCQPKHDIALGILLAATKEELMELHAIRGLLHDLRTILVLPDQNKATISRGHELQPRFLTNDLSSVTAVVEKMLRNLRARGEEKGNGPFSRNHMNS